jgi:hypothetical protein
VRLQRLLASPQLPLSIFTIKMSRTSRSGFSTRRRLPDCLSLSLMTMDNWDTKLRARTIWENICACEPRAMLGSRWPVA